MQLNPYLMFNGQCREAFKFYEQLLGGEIVFMMTYVESPAAEHMPPQGHDLIMHASLKLGNRC
jgi:PhnB protein